MDETERPQWGDGLLISAPRLYQLQFLREAEEDIPPDAQGEVNFNLQLTRLATDSMGVEFGVEVMGVPGLLAMASYRMTVTLVEGSPEAADPETAFRHAAARLAPTILYPYVREALGTSAMKAQVPNFVLPVVNFGKVYHPDTVNVPPPLEQGGLEIDG